MLVFQCVYVCVNVGCVLINFVINIIGKSVAIFNYMVISSKLNLTYQLKERKRKIITMGYEASNMTI